MARPTPTQLEPVQPMLMPCMMEVEINGAWVRIQPNCDLPGLLRLLSELIASGARFKTLPITFDRTAEGLPICSKHRQPMIEREKQGSRWFSHRVVSPDGHESWCRGFPGPLSPGWDHDDTGRIESNGY